MSRKKNGKKRKSALVSRLEYLLYRMIVLPLRSASNSRMERWAGRTGSYLPRLLSRRHQMVLRNLEYVFPERSVAEREEIAAACWKFFAGFVFRFLRSTPGPGSEPIVAVLNDEATIRALLAQQRGLIVVTAHLGHWEGALNVLNEMDVDATVVVRMLDNPLIDRDLYRARLRPTVEVTDRRSAARSLIRTLERKGVVILLTDQAVQKREGILVPFLGRPAWTTPAAARLALRADVPIVCVFASGGTAPVVVEVGAVIDPRELSESQRDVTVLTTMINDVISERIRREPHLWLWMHDRWKGARQ